MQVRAQCALDCALGALIFQYSAWGGGGGGAMGGAAGGVELPFANLLFDGTNCEVVELGGRGF